MYRIIIAITVLLISCNEAPKSINQGGRNAIMAKRIKIDALNDEIQKLQNGQTEYDFIGITSNGIDCVYFKAGAQEI